MKNDYLIQVRELKKYFPIKKGLLRRVKGYIKAVDNISFHLMEGETVGLVGESGCGKSTTGRCINRLFKPTAGDVLYKNSEGEIINVTELSRRELKTIYKDIQMIFQDPFSSLDSRMSVRDIVAEPLKVNNIGDRKMRTEKVDNLLNRVGLSSYQMNRYPHEFSGGQRQRIGVARALALNPRLIICDEPVSALDVSVQAQVINLLEDLQDEFGFTYLFIAHDLSVVEHISDRVMVMYLGKLVETASSNLIYEEPLHPYTESLLGSIPVGDPRIKKKRKSLPGNVPDPSDPPSGCNLAPRCPYVEEKCKNKEPKIVKKEKDNIVRTAACHFVDELKLNGYKELANDTPAI